MTANATRVANAQGGAQSRRVTVRLYPSVAVSVGKNALKEREVMMQAILHTERSWKQSGKAENDALQCHVHDLPICQGIKENLPMTLDFGLTFIASASVLFHSLHSQFDFDRRQPTVRSRGKIWKNERGDEGDENRQSTLNKK